MASTLRITHVQMQVCDQHLQHVDICGFEGSTTLMFLVLVVPVTTVNLRVCGLKRDLSDIGLISVKHKPFFCPGYIMDVGKLPVVSFTFFCLGKLDCRLIVFCLFWPCSP